MVIICLLLAMLLDPELHDCSTSPELCVFSLTGAIQDGLPAFQPPPFSVAASNITDSHGDLLAPVDVGFQDMVATLGPAIIIIPIIAILESVAIAKAFGIKCLNPFNYITMHCFSWRQACRCQPGDDSSGTL